MEGPLTKECSMCGKLRFTNGGFLMCSTCDAPMILKPKRPTVRKRKKRKDQ